MNPVDIILHPEKPVDVEEQVSVIEWYIKQCKGVDVKIRVPHPQDYQHLGPFAMMIASQELEAIGNAFIVACNWASQNRSKLGIV